MKNKTIIKNEINWQTRINCNQIDHSKSNTSICLMGWVDTIRDHGHLLFCHLRDKTGIVQLVFDPDKNKDVHETAQNLRNEFVVSITGILSERSEETVNSNIQNGQFEIIVETLTILNKSKTPPFSITEKDQINTESSEFKVDEDLRLKHRYLDLRRPQIQDNIIKRSQILNNIRTFMNENAFLEIETPVLTKSTPEGARDYLVPSRNHHSKFYALPQSPQLFKQMLMMSGFERYYQVVRCFRDEDLRPNRQPEFTQLDIEASFIDESYIYNLMENLLVALFKEQGISLTTPFPKITYEDSMNKYGNDRPDLRYDMKMIEITDIVKSCEFKVFQSIASNNGCIKGINIKGQANNLSKNMLQNELALKVIPKLGGKGLAWMKVENDELQSNIVQFFSTEEKEQIKQALNAENGDVLVFVADKKRTKTNEVLGRFRSYIAERLDIIPKNTYAPCWVIDFPLFEQKDGHLHAIHHPFTQPKEVIKNNTPPTSSPLITTS